MGPREAEEIRIQIAEAVQRRDELYGKHGKLKISTDPRLWHYISDASQNFQAGDFLSSSIC
jgi:hypothetical protein